MLALLVVEPVLSPLQAAVLGAVQGLTELLPISSSAHLYLVPTLLGWPYAGVAYDVAMHAGTLLALVVAFLGDWLALLKGLTGPQGPARESARQLFGMIVVATIPGLVAGKVLGELEERLRSVPLQASTLLVFGLLLWWVDARARRREEKIAPTPDTAKSDRPDAPPTPTWGTALLVGFSQALALIPGVSRSGITMTAGRLGGLSRLGAARFSFMLSMPITLAAVLYTGLLKSRDLVAAMPMSTLAIGVASAAVSSFLAIQLMLGILRRTGFAVFAAYRVVLAIGLFVWVATR